MTDNILKTYADSGLRTVENWNSLGREIDEGTKPATVTPHRGALLPLFSRHQTHPRARAQGAPESATQAASPDA